MCSLAPTYSRINNLNQRLKVLALKLRAPLHESALQCAGSLQGILEPPLQVFARLCPELCPACPEDCCRRVSHRGVMDTPDLVFLAAQGITTLPRAARQDGLCPWLGDKGCALPWNARPFACLHYLCAPFQNAMSPAELEQIKTSLAQAGDARSRLLRLFMEP